MTTIILPPEIEKTLVEEAEKRGTTPELLAVDCLRDAFISSPEVQSSGKTRTLFDFLSGYIGTVNGTNEALSEDSGHHFVEGLIDKQQRGNV